MSFLSAVGHEFKVVFSWLGSSKGQATIATVEGAAAAITTAVNPVAGAALVGIEALINAALKSVVNAESLAAAAGAQSGSGPQKAVAAAAAVAPQVQSVLVSLGVKEPTAAQVETITRVVTDALVTIFKAFPEPVAAPAA
jgi:hypothetical protein